jgi:hypothetical protein
MEITFAGLEKLPGLVIRVSEYGVEIDASQARVRTVRTSGDVPSDVTTVASGDATTARCERASH